MNTKKVRCVNRKTGEVAYNISMYANDRSWQRLTGFTPEPEPQACEFKSESKESSTKTTNEKTSEAIQSGNSGRASTGQQNTNSKA